MWCALAANSQQLYPIFSLDVHGQLPFEEELDYRKFTVKVAEKDVPKLKQILLAIPEVHETATSNFG